MNKINLYGAEWCKPCREVKALLDELNLDYTFYDVDHNSTEFIQTLTQIPVIQFVNDNAEVVNTHIGAISKRHLLKLVEDDGKGQG